MSVANKQFQLPPIGSSPVKPPVKPPGKPPVKPPARPLPPQTPPSLKPSVNSSSRPFVSPRSPHGPSGASSSAPVLPVTLNNTNDINSVNSPVVPAIPAPSKKEQKRAAILLQKVFRTWKARRDYKVLYEKRKWTLHDKGNVLTNHVTKNRVAARPGRRPPTRGKRAVGLAEPTQPPKRFVTEVPESDTNNDSPSVEPESPSGPTRATQLSDASRRVTAMPGSSGGLLFDPTQVKLKKATTPDSPTPPTGPSRSPIADLRANLRPTTMIAPSKNNPSELSPNKQHTDPNILLTPPPVRNTKVPDIASVLASKRPRTNSDSGPSTPKSPSSNSGPSTPSRKPVPPLPSKSPKASPVPPIPMKSPPVPPIASKPGQKHAFPDLPEISIEDLAALAAGQELPGPSRAILSPRSAQRVKKKRITKVLNNFIPRRPAPEELMDRGLLPAQPDGTSVQLPNPAQPELTQIVIEFPEMQKPRVSSSAICLNSKCCKSLKKSNKRHCRRCGKVYCKDCLNKKQVLPELKYSKPVPICDKCFHSRRKEEIDLKAEFIKQMGRNQS